MGRGTRSKAKGAHKRSLETAGSALYSAAAEVSGSSSTSSSPQQQQRENKNIVKENLLGTLTSQKAHLVAASSSKVIEFDTSPSLSAATTETSANTSSSTQQSELAQPSTPQIQLPSSTFPDKDYSPTFFIMPPILLVVQPRGLENFITKTGIVCAEGRDTWITEWGMKLADVLPCLPEVYEMDGLAGKAVYVLGIANRVKTPDVGRLFSRHGRVISCPVILDMASEDSFRFVIMASAAEADRAVHKLNGSIFQGDVIHVCKALNPNDDLRFPDVYRVDRIFAGELNPTAEQLAKMKEKIAKEAKEKAKGKGKGPAIPAVLYIPANHATLTVHGHPAPAQGFSIQQPVQQHLQQPAQQAVQLSIEPLVHQLAQQTLQPAAPHFVPQKSQPQQSQSHEPQPQQPQPRPSPPTPVLPQQSSILQREAEELSTVVPEVASAEFKKQAVSWASVASSSTNKAKTIDLNPERKQTNTAPRLHPVGRIPAISITQPAESMIEQMRVVFLLNLPTNITLQDISDAIIEGPLVSIRFGIDANNGSRYAGIIFQFAQDAEAFYQVLCKEGVDAKPSRFRFLVDAVRGEAFPADSVIDAMSPPTNASRRLTIVKSRFFFIFGERHLRNLCEKAVGVDNVQLIWLYNGGNATVVFAEVAAAMKIKKILDKMRDDAADNGISSEVWEGLQTTYSKDPCVQPLRLETAMHD